MVPGRWANLAAFEFRTHRPAFRISPGGRLSPAVSSAKQSGKQSSTPSAASDGVDGAVVRTLQAAHASFEFARVQVHGASQEATAPSSLISKPGTPGETAKPTRCTVSKFALMRALPFWEPDSVFLCAFRWRVQKSGATSFRSVCCSSAPLALWFVNCTSTSCCGPGRTEPSLAQSSDACCRKRCLVVGSPDAQV